MRLAVHCFGDGPALYAVHGWGLHGGVWSQAELWQGYRLSAVDLPGHGRSPFAHSDSPLCAWADAVAEAAPPEALWVGWSLGGLVALAAARRARPRGLLLVGATPRFVQAHDWPHAVEPQVLANFAADLAHDRERTLARFLALQARGAGRPGRAAAERLRVELRRLGPPDGQALEVGLELLRSSDLRDTLTEIECPLRAVFGERDTLVPIATAPALSRLCPSAEVEVIERAGHVPFLSHATEFRRALDEFRDVLA